MPTELWSCASCREVTTEDYDFDAGTMAQYERHSVRCPRSPVAFINPECERVILKTHPAWCGSWKMTLT